MFLVARGEIEPQTPGPSRQGSAVLDAWHCGSSTISTGEPRLNEALRDCTTRRLYRPRARRETHLAGFADSQECCRKPRCFTLFLYERMSSTIWHRAGF